MTEVIQTEASSEIYFVLAVASATHKNDSSFGAAVDHTDGSST